MSSRAIRFFSILMLAGAAACSRTGTTGDPANLPAPAGAPFNVELTNTTGVPVTVSYVMGDITTAVGSVNAGQTTQIQITNRGSDNIEIVAMDANQKEIFRKTFDLESGQLNRITIEKNLP